jgi:hypothetical protein
LLSTITTTIWKGSVLKWFDQGAEFGCFQLSSTKIFLGEKPQFVLVS